MSRLLGQVFTQKLAGFAWFYQSNPLSIQLAWWSHSSHYCSCDSQLFGHSRAMFGYNSKHVTWCISVSRTMTQHLKKKTLWHSTRIFWGHAFWNRLLGTWDNAHSTSQVRTPPRALRWIQLSRRSPEKLKSWIAWIWNRHQQTSQSHLPYKWANGKWSKSP